MIYIYIYISVYAPEQQRKSGAAAMSGSEEAVNGNTL
jgi:hypothetical protein